MNNSGVKQKPKDIQKIRYHHDSMYDAGIQKVDAEQIARQQSLKRKNLAVSVKIVPEIFPKLYEAIESVRAKVAPDEQVEAFVYNSPDIQAYSFGKSDQGKIAIGFSSGIVKAFSFEELMFVIGHELGHSIMGHHNYPVDVPYLTEVERLNLLALQRAAEITADRVGFLSCTSKEVAFRSILKLASGLTDDMIRFDIAVYLDQARELKKLGGSEFELMSTHPMFTARIHTLLWFEMSQIFYDWIDKKGEAPLNDGTLDAKVEKELASISGFKLVKINEEAMNSALIWGVMALFVADNKLSKAEQSLLERTFGDVTSAKVIEFVKKSGPAGVMKKLEASLKNIKMQPVHVKETYVEELENFAKQAAESEESCMEVLKTICATLGIKSRKKQKTLYVTD